MNPTIIAVAGQCPRHENHNGWESTEYLDLERTYVESF